MGLSSRERVIATINHREPDRVPVDVQCGLDFYLKLKRHLGLDFEEHYEASYHREVIPDYRLCKVMGWDAVSVKLVKPRKNFASDPEPEQVFDGWGVGRKRVTLPTGGILYEAVHHPLQNATLSDLDKYPWPDPRQTGMAEATEAHAKWMHENTDLALIGRFGGTIIEQAIDLMGFENWLMATALNPELVGSLLDRITEIAIQGDLLGLQAAGKYIQIFKVSGDDLGMQNRTLYSPKTFLNLLLPRLKRRWQAARNYIDQNLDDRMPLMFHSDGAIRNFIPALIEGGIGVLNPIQPGCAGMEPEGLKRDFGDRLVFHGGIDVQSVLPQGTPMEVESAVRQAIKSLAPGGGYILSPSHFVQSDISPENVIAMTKAVHQYGRYPIAL